MRNELVALREITGRACKDRTTKAQPWPNGGSAYYLNEDKDKGHHPNDFINQISNLPQGNYIVVDGQIIKVN